jgi:hypothetical protein
MKQLTNKQLADLREKWIFYCNHYIEELYKAGFNPSDTLKDGAKENELVLRLIESAIADKALKKKQKNRRLMALWGK